MPVCRPSPAKELRAFAGDYPIGPRRETEKATPRVQNAVNPAHRVSLKKRPVAGEFAEQKKIPHNFFRAV